jgi:tripartite-type tricarboxylate transporter receptor subunit TctC
MHMRQIIMLAATALATVGFVSTSAAQDYPAKAVKIIVPFAAGGPADVYARFMGEQLSQALKQPFVVENRPGAGSIIGTDAAAKSPPDGYTLLMMSNTHTVNESLIPNKPFQLMRDFIPVAPVNSSDLVLAVHPSVPANTLAEFIAQLKAKPKALNYASSGNGTPYHMAGELFKVMSGTDIVHVAYSGSSQARNDLIGGHVHMMIDAITAMSGNAAAGQVRALATTGTKRSSVLPDVPTATEAGLAGYEATIWLGLMAPTGTPKAIVDTLNAEINKIVARDDVKAAWAKQGAETLVMTPSAFEAYLKRDIDRWAGVVKSAGIKIP